MNIQFVKPSMVFYLLYSQSNLGTEARLLFEILACKNLLIYEEFPNASYTLYITSYITLIPGQK